MPVQFDVVWSTCYSRCILFVSTALSCHVLPWCVIKYYHLSLYPRLRVPVPPSCVHRDRRPDQNRKRRPVTPFCFPFWKVLFCSSVCVSLSHGMEVATRHSRHSPLQVGVGVRRDRRECRESTGREPLMPADRGRYPSPAVALPSPPASLPSSRVAAPPGAPFAGDHATGSPLTQCPPARLWLNARRPAAVLKPAGLPLTQAHGSALIHARWPPLSLAPWIKSTCDGQECRVSVLSCPQEHFNYLVLSCPWWLVWGRRLLMLWPWRPF